MNDIKGHTRAIKDSLDTKYDKIISGDHNCIPWLMKHAADVIHRRRVGRDGRTAYKLWKGKHFNKHVAEFGEHVWFLRAGSAGKDKFNVRWEDGIWLGVINESGEKIMGTEQGTTKVKDFRRK